MRIEHTGYMVQDPVAVAAWYVEHLGFTIKRAMDKSPNTHFLADETGTVLIEIYNNPQAMVPDYAAIDPLVLHLGFAVDDVDAEKSRLLAAGATIQRDLIETVAGDRLVMLRDPWGFPIQLCQRAESMIGQVTDAFLDR